MGSAAELYGEIAHLHHADFLAVLLAEQCHGPGLPCILYPHHFRHYGKIRGNLLVNPLLHPFQLFFCHGRKMAEVKAQTLAVHIGACLFHMGAKHLPERLVEQMGSTVVFTGITPLHLVHSKGGNISHLEHPPGNGTDMPHLAAEKLYCILHREAAVRRRDYTRVRILSTHGGVEGRLLHDDSACLPVCQRLNQLTFRGQNGDF